MIQTATRDESPQQGGGPFGMSFHQVIHWRYQEFSPAECWSPAVNVYQFDDRYEVCVDLAGVDVRQLELRVDASKLLVRGVRGAPQPGEDTAAMRIVLMEIDHGPFSRSIEFDRAIEPRSVAMRYRNGMLWITLGAKRH